MKLLLDIGNSRIKWAAGGEALPATVNAFTYEKTRLREDLESGLKTSLEPEQVVIASVIDDSINAELSDYFSSRWGTSTRFLQVSAMAAGVCNAYREPRQLGIDRWLAIIAAWNRYRSPLCVVDCGTALTIDLVTASGQHLGGYIIPGMALMREALAAHTDRIAGQGSHAAGLEPGLSTTDCIGNGALRAISALVQSVFGQHRHEHGAGTRCIITGGNAPEIGGSLADDVEYEPALVLRGMAILMAEK